MNRPNPPPRRWLACGAAVVALGLAASLGRGQSVLVANSPFAPASGALTPAAALAAQDYELTGSTAEGSTVTVCVYTRQTRRSQWIPVGGIIDGIRVISYDADHDQAVVLVGGVRKEISMRKATYTGRGGLGAGTPPLAMAAAAPPPAPVAVARPPGADGAAAANPEAEQREARMLVSDLLEIGVQQRKANQEARQKAAAGSPQTPNN